MHNQSPEPNTNNNHTPSYINNPTQWIDMLPWQIPRPSSHNKHTKYGPLIHNLQYNGWKPTPLLLLKVRGAIHEHSIYKLTSLKILKFNIKTLVENIHQDAIKYLTCLALNKRKFDKKQTHVPLPQWIWKLLTYHQSPPLKKEVNTLSCITNDRDQQQVNGLTFTPVPRFEHYLFLFFFSLDNFFFESM